MKDRRMTVTREFLIDLADAAAQETLPRFRQHGAIMDKGMVAGVKAYDPVTEADQAAEHAIIRLIEQHFSDHGILGEEHGGKGLDRRHVWVIDPIDGTRAFITGIPVWGTLVGLMDDGKAIAGMMSQPFTDEFFYAVEGKSFRRKGKEETVNRVSGVTSLSNASLFTTTPHLFRGDDRARYDGLERDVKLFRYGCDCYAYCMLAAGFVDLVVETALQPYDIVALVPIIEAAGGIVTNWDGSRPEAGGNIIAAATVELHAAAMARMRS
jgi:histidinol phosphatase-like enzyme (inositol monophosphatase family)